MSRIRPNSTEKAYIPLTEPSDSGETTLVGSSLPRRGNKAAENYSKEKEKTRIIDLSEAMQTYKSPNLPPELFKDKVSKDDIESRFPESLKG